MVSSVVHAHTPELIVCEGRGLVVRQVLLHRTEATEAAAMRVTRQRFDPAGRMIAATDPRLASANRSTVYSLGGNALATGSVDAGWQRVLFGEAGQVLRDWDGRGTEKQLEYDLHLRPTRIIEQNRCAERFTFGQADAAAHNQCNQLVRHDDTAGSRLLADYGLLGVALCEERQFLQPPESPDWPLAEAERDALLEPVVLQTCWRFNALGDALAQTDAMGNTQASGMTVAGQLKAAGLTLAGASQPQTLVNEIHYNAFNQVEQETAGNGVVSLYSYDQQDGRLTGLSAISTDGTLLQQLNYSYDPVGNVLLVNDASQPDRYCDNQLIEPISHYRYDTLYQLIEASGREVRNVASHGPALPGLQPLPTLDPCQVSNYRQNYSYDAAGNLLQMRHEGAHNFTRNMRVAPDSNRSLPDDDGEVDFATSFDANGNLLQLVRGQIMGWDVRNQLQHITTVQREDGSNDDERYVYDGQGQRCRKISTAQASGRTLINEVRYLPGLEIRTTADGEILHVITAQAGRNSVRVLHWEAGKPGAIASDQVRYSLGDHLGSSTLELDQQGGLISQESYYPFGGTAWWAARSAVEAKYKTVRYSGKERDASGLYYYGFRYYAPWLQRWISPDPAGDVDGLNAYNFVSNNPVMLIDKDGRIGERIAAAYAPNEPALPSYFKDTYLSEASNDQMTADARAGALWNDPPRFLGAGYAYAPAWYYNANLQQRIDSVNERSWMSRAIVTTLFNHDHDPAKKPYEITSRHWNNVDEFTNTYTPEKWMIQSNFKASKSNDYHASDVIRYQYETVSKSWGFFGVLPSLVENQYVINKKTLDTTSEVESGTAHLLDIYLNETPIGKGTSILMAEFQMEALWVQRQIDPVLDPISHFALGVKPINHFKL
ncbi:RHS repeat domain-containing protein [Pseudomonas fragariae (ex Marin et al. 2024)]|uniref:RHS repeat domain-containing protein n=1 Tax=Pseudomonas TaxID=286 RepID=UPI0004525380|nr:RHS repeat-associated core domain-containing protein [Pseudomonas syringae]AKF47653.1 RHS repeat-associated core domain protein [Pseudomonas syringae pv. syringae B301D]EXL32502.1 putative insecticidal toxin complex protein C3 [Pseudomonas syringae pv. syringae str. B301D-R]